MDMNQKSAGMEILSFAKEQEKCAREAKEVIEKLDASQLKVEKNAFDAINSSDTALNLVKEGMKNIENLSKKIDALNKAVISSSNTLKQMEQLTIMIIGFANVIGGISNKTNMLSLNASIEAARAGEQGRGFAVVAKEVGNLAAKSSKSSKEITETIKAVQSFSGNMGNDMQKLFSIVKEQNEVAIEVEDVFKQILEASFVSNDVSRNMENEIAFQRDVTDNVKSAVNIISDIAERTVKYSEDL